MSAALPIPSLPGESQGPIPYLPAALAESCTEDSYVVIIRTREDFYRWLAKPVPGAELLQVEGLIHDQDGWALAAQGLQPVPLDVILDDPATEFSSLYRLVDVRNARPVRVTLPARPGFMKALRLAVSLHMPVRLLPGQPDTAALAELDVAAAFYLRDPMVEVPVEFFHSLFASFCQPTTGTLWTFLEQDPADCSYRDERGQALLPPDFVKNHLAGIVAAGGECATCRWQAVCAGYFKHPDVTYQCAGVKRLFTTLEAAAAELKHDLAELMEPEPAHAP